MSLAERLIEQTFANASIDVASDHSDMIVGTLRAIDGQQILSIVLVDNGLAGLKLLALTTGALSIINGWGDLSAQHSIEDIAEVSVGFGTLTIAHELSSGGTMRDTFALADKTGVHGLQTEFNELRGR